MSLVAGWALAGLVLLAPLVILHLRPRAGAEREVPSLLLWHEFQLDAHGRTRRLARPPLPLLLALQALALILLILTLAQPVLSGARAPAATVIVLDDSVWMTAPGALADARREADQTIRAAPAGSSVRIVLADSASAVLYRGPASGAAAALSRVRASDAAPDLSRALMIAAGLLTGSRDRVLVIRAPEDPLPAVRAGRGTLRTVIAGRATADEGIEDPVARCGIGSPATCEVIATVTNAASSPAEVHLVAGVAGHPSLSLATHVGARSSTQVHLLADPDEPVSLRLSRSDALSADDRAWVTVPGDDDIPRSSTVTVVGTPAQARSLAQAFAAVPGVSLRLRTPADYRATDARTSDLVIFDAALPGGRLPPAPTVMLIDPRRLPGGRVGRAQSDPTLSGADATSPLLADADLSSLTLSGGAARALTLPRWLVRVLWSPSGPLLAAGDEGHGRLIVTAFAPDGSNLAQLDGFPVLAANIVRWSLGWAPAAAPAGAPIRVDALPGAVVATLRRDGTTVDRVALGATGAVLRAPAPGAYTLAETGPGVDHRATVDVNVGVSAPASPVPVDLEAAQLRAGRAPGTALAPWLLAAALVVLGLEWAYWSRRRGALPA